MPTGSHRKAGNGTTSGIQKFGLQSEDSKNKAGGNDWQCYEFSCPEVGTETCPSSS